MVRPQAVHAPAIGGACVCHGELSVWPVSPSAQAKSLVVSAALIRPLLDLAAARMLDAQHSVPAWSQSAQLDYVPLARADRWIEEACLTLRDPTLGLSALARVERGAADVVELAAERAATLMDALLVLTRFMTAVNEAAVLHLYVQDGSAILVIGSEIYLTHALREYLLGVVALTAARWLGPDAGLEVWFARPRPSHTSAYRHAFGESALAFHAACDALVLPAASLWVEMPNADRRLHTFLVNAAQRLALRSARLSLSTHYAAR